MLKEHHLDTKLTKENILRLTDSYELINFYLKPYHNKNSLQQGKNISNPLISSKQKTPSFNIYKNKSGIWKYKDFAISDCNGTVFDLIMKLRGCNFVEAMQLINEDFNLGLHLTSNKKSPEVTIAENWSDAATHYWLQYGILLEHLKTYKVHPVAKITRYKGNGEAFDMVSSPSNPIFAYQITASCYKIYNPLKKSFRFSWIGKKPESYVFGLSQLPEQGEKLFITGGEKDVLSLFSRGYSAICFNSETSNPDPKLIVSLKQRFQKVIVLYDIDKTGLEHSMKLAKNHNLYRAVLNMDKKYGKDISDYLKVNDKLSKSALTITRLNREDQSHNEKHLTSLCEISNQLTKIIRTEIKTPPSLLLRDGEGTLFPQSIHLVQGRSGTHKSRLAQTICSALLKKEDCTNELLGLYPDPRMKSVVCYVDTERNLTYQLPRALQEIQMDAGYSREEKPRNFYYTSLVKTQRSERFSALCSYLDNVQKELTDEHLVVVLDVISDCVMDFNSTQDSLLLIDKLNTEINKREKKIAFIAVIHENPGGGADGKPRGHLGTEIVNKATSSFKIAFEDESSDVILISFPKNRNGKKPKTAAVRFCENTKRLKLATYEIAKVAKVSKTVETNLQQIKNELGSFIRGRVAARELEDHLCRVFPYGNRTIRKRLEELSKNYYEIINYKQVKCQLRKIKVGRYCYYILEPIVNPTSEMKKA